MPRSSPYARSSCSSVSASASGRLDVTLLLEWSDGRRQALLFLVEEEYAEVSGPSRDHVLLLRPEPDPLDLMKGDLVAAAGVEPCRLWVRAGGQGRRTPAVAGTPPARQRGSRAALTMRTVFLSLETTGLGARTDEINAIRRPGRPPDGPPVRADREPGRLSSTHDRRLDRRTTHAEKCHDHGRRGRSTTLGSGYRRGLSRG